MRPLNIIIASLFFTYSSHASSLAYDFSDLLPFDMHQESLWYKNLVKETGLEAQTPTTISFVTGAKQVSYIALSHTADFPANPTSPQFLCIASIIASFQPDLMILEGFDDSEDFITYVRQISQNPDPTKVVQETTYAAHLAQQKNIPFIGGEPCDHDILAGLLQKGYTTDDMAFFYFLQQVPQEDRENKLTDANVEERFVRLSNQWQYIFGNTHTYEDFQKWCTRKVGRTLCLEEIMDAFCAFPESFLTTIQKDAMLIRDQTIVQRLLKACEKHSKVLIIYGASHYYTQHKVLEKYLGAPKYEVFTPQAVPQVFENL